MSYDLPDWWYDVASMLAEDTVASKEGLEDSLYIPGGGTQMNFADCCGVGIEIGDLVFVRDTALDTHGFAKEGDNYFVFAGHSCTGNILLERNSELYIAESWAVRKAEAVRVASDADGKPMSVGDPVRIRLSRMNEYRGVDENNRMFTVINISKANNYVRITRGNNAVEMVVIAAHLRLNN